MQLLVWLYTKGNRCVTIKHFNIILGLPINKSCQGGRVWQGSGWRHEGHDRRQKWVTRSPCDLIWFYITVSFNHCELREMMKGWWIGVDGCVWNAMNKGMCLGCFPILKFFFFFKPNPVTNLIHLGKANTQETPVLVCIFLTKTK